MALKDWKKVTFDDGSFKYINKKRNGTLHIGNSLFSKQPDVSVEIDIIRVGGVNLPKTHIYKEFKTKPQALRFAKSYMRSH